MAYRKSKRPCHPERSVTQPRDPGLAEDHGSLCHPRSLGCIPVAQAPSIPLGMTTDLFSPSPPARDRSSKKALSSRAECNEAEGPRPPEDHGSFCNQRSLDCILVAQASSIPLGMTCGLDLRSTSRDEAAPESSPGLRTSGFVWNRLAYLSSSAPKSLWPFSFCSESLSKAFFASSGLSAFTAASTSS